MNRNKNWWLIKIDRVSAWILLFSMFLYFLTGYGMTKQIINSTFSSKLHLDILPLIIMIAFAVHSSLAVRLALMRWRFWNRASMAVLILIYASFLVGFGYVELFYRNNKKTTSAGTTSGQQVKTEEDEEESEGAIQSPLPTSTSLSQSSTKSSEKIFTKSELAKYNGQNNMAAYVAVDGVVYDVTSVFTNGNHFSHLAGQELTNAFYSRHAKSSISKYPVVGRLK